MTTDTLTPLIKWPGGKRRELPEILPRVPDYVQEKRPYRYVEPFLGGGAVFWALRNPNSVVGDLDEDLILFYRAVAAQDPDMFRLLKPVEQAYASGDREAQAAEYYRIRAMDKNGGLSKLTPGERAGRFFVLNQLAYGGLRRFNDAGEFNVPFGKYKNFRTDRLRSAAHVEMLRSADLRLGSYEHLLREFDQPQTFIFIDPPYTRSYTEYSKGEAFGPQEQEELAEALLGLKHAQFMIVINKDELTTRLYGANIIHEYRVRYSVNIRNRFDGAEKHIMATNYQPTAQQQPVQQQLLAV